MSNYTVDFSLEIPFDACDLAEMEQVAKTAVSWCRRHMKLGDEFHLHEEDMQQTALLALYHHRLSSRPRAFSQAQYALMNYVLVSIWGITRYASQFQEGQFCEILAEDLRTGTHRDDQEMVDLLQPHGERGQSRPVEDEAIWNMQSEDTEAWWQRVEREILYVLVGQRGKWETQTLLTAARLITLRCQGCTFDDIAERLGVPGEYVQNTLYGIREYVNDYLALSPMMQQMVRLQGRLTCYHHDELTPEVLNQLHRYVVVFPHGAFTLHCRKRSDSTTRYEKCLQANRKVNGKHQSCAVNVGPVGKITYEKLYEATHRIQAKMQQRQMQLCGRANGVYA